MHSSWFKHMRNFIHELKTSLFLTLVLGVICCAAYPLLVYAAGQLLFPRQANGSLFLDEKGTVRGSYLIAQQFSGDGYFHARASAAGADGYDAAASSGSNLGPTSLKLRDQIAQRIAQYRERNDLPDGQVIPADAVTTSGSGLDPHISAANARLQAPRVARIRGVNLEALDTMILQCMDARAAGLFGEEGVNVLKLNVLLDQTCPVP